MLYQQSSPSQLPVIPSFMLLELKILGVILIPLFLSLPTSNCQANTLGIESNYYLTIFTANSLVHKLSLHTSRLFHRQLNPTPPQPFLPPFPLQTFLNQAQWYCLQNNGLQGHTESACVELSLVKFWPHLPPLSSPFTPFFQPHGLFAFWTCQTCSWLRTFALAVPLSFSMRSTLTTLLKIAILLPVFL